MQCAAVPILAQDSHHVRFENGPYNLSTDSVNDPERPSAWAPAFNQIFEENYGRLNEKSRSFR
jgi:hypothetical protein